VSINETVQDCNNITKAFIISY